MDIENKLVRIGIGVLVLDNASRILLGKRKSDNGKNTYSLPGGHLEFGESFEECAKRELKEETNLDGFDFKVVSLGNGIGEYKHYVTIGLLAKSFTGENELMKPDKFEFWGWYGKNNLPEPLFPPSKIVIENYFSRAFYK